VCAFCFLGMAAAIAYKEREQGRLGVIQFLSMEAAAPVQQGFDRLTRKLVGIWESYIMLVNVDRENRELREQIRRLKHEINSYREESLENRRLRELLDFKRRVDTLMIPAEVVGRDPSDWYRSIIIDKGSRSHVRKDMAVVSYEGIVGRVISASPNYAKILLILDRNSAVSAVIQRTRARSILSGTGENYCLLKYVAPSEDVRVGDAVISSGLNGIFPKGLLLGAVVRVDYRPGELFQTIRVAPAVDVYTLEEVMVLLGPPHADPLRITPHAPQITDE